MNQIITDHKIENGVLKLNIYYMKVYIPREECFSTPRYIGKEERGPYSNYYYGNFFFIEGVVEISTSKITPYWYLKDKIFYPLDEFIHLCKDADLATYLKLKYV